MVVAILFIRGGGSVMVMGLGRSGLGLGTLLVVGLGPVMGLGTRLGLGRSCVETRMGPGLGLQSRFIYA